MNEFADPAVDQQQQGMYIGGVEQEQEWRVIQEQLHQQQQQQQQYDRSEPRRAMGGKGGGGGASDSRTASLMKQKDEEIARLYMELSALRKDFDKKIVALKEEHKSQTGQMREQIEQQTKQYEQERLQLSAQLKELTQEMIEREKAYRSGDDATNNKLRQDLRQKEKEYEATLSGLNSRISELESELFKVKNELKYNVDASEQEKEQMTSVIAAMEEEQANLVSQNKELEKELIQDKRLVVETTQEASRVLEQLELMKNSKEEEVTKLSTRIQELEAQITQMQVGGDMANQDVEMLKREHEQEREMMNQRIMELEAMQDGSWQPEGAYELQQERDALSHRVAELEENIEAIKNELTERDKLLRTSNKATDILLDQMEAQKLDFEKELERTTALAEELEEAISTRELEMELLQEQFSTLERMTEGLKSRNQERRGEGRESRDQGMQSMGMGRGREDSGRWMKEREARLAAEREVEKLTAMMNENRRSGQGATEPKTKKSKSFFEQMFGARGDSEKDDVMSEQVYSEEIISEEYTMEYGGRDDYALLNDVLTPDAVAPRRTTDYKVARESSMPRESLGRRSNDARYGAESAPGGESPYYNSMTPSPAVAREPPVQVPTPQLEFERRLAENPIVPAGGKSSGQHVAVFLSLCCQLTKLHSRHSFWRIKANCSVL